MGKFDFRKLFERYFPPAISLTVLILGILERNPIVAVLGIMLYFIIAGLETLVKMYEEMRVNNAIMIDLLDVVESEYDDEDDEEFDSSEGDFTPFENTQPAPKARKTLDETDDSTWAELIKKLKNKDDK